MLVGRFKKFPTRMFIRLISFRYFPFCQTKAITHSSIDKFESTLAKEIYFLWGWFKLHRKNVPRFLYLYYVSEATNDVWSWIKSCAIDFCFFLQKLTNIFNVSSKLYESIFCWYAYFEISTHKLNTPKLHWTKTLEL